VSFEQDEVNLAV